MPGVAPPLKCPSTALVALHCGLWIRMNAYVQEQALLSSACMLTLYPHSCDKWIHSGAAQSLSTATSGCSGWHIFVVVRWHSGSGTLSHAMHGEWAHAVSTNAQRYRIVQKQKCWCPTGHILRTRRLCGVFYKRLQAS